MFIDHHVHSNLFFVAGRVCHYVGMQGSDAFWGVGDVRETKELVVSKIWNIVDHYPAILGVSSMMSLVMWVPKPLKCQQ